MGEDFAVLLCLFAGEFVVLAADGEVVLVGLGNGVLGATPVAVPEAAVDEDVGAILRQDEIGVTIRNKPSAVN